MKVIFTAILTCLVLTLFGQESKTELLINTGHSETASAIHSPDGKYVLSYSNDGSIKLWDVKGNLIKRYAAHGKDVNDVDFFPDGRTFVSVSSDKSMKKWDLEKGLLKTITNSKINCCIHSVDVSPDGKYIITGDRKNILMWSSEGELLRTIYTLGEDEEHIMFVSFSPDSKWIIGSVDKSITLWSASGGSSYASFSGSYVNQGSFSKDMKYLLTYDMGTNDNFVRLFDFESKEELLKISVRNTTKAEFINDSVFAVASGKYQAGGKLAFYKYPQGKLVKSVKLLESERVVNIEPAQQIVSTIPSLQGRLRIRDLNGNVVEQFDISKKTGISAVSYSHDGKLIATGSYDHNITIWTKDGSYVRAIPTAFDSYISALDFSSDGEYLIVAGLNNKELALYNVEGELIKKFEGHTSYNYGAGFLPDGRIYSSSHDGSLKLWDIKGTELKSVTAYPGGGGVTSALSTDGKYIATGYGALTRSLQNVLLFNTTDLSYTNLGNTNGERVNAIAVNSDGSIVATSSFENNQITLWTSSGVSKKLKGNTTSESDYGKAIKFSPDGKYLAAGFFDNTITIWTTEGDFVKTLKGHTAKISSIDFSSDSQYLVSGSMDSETIIWNLTTNNSMSLVAKDSEWIVFNKDGIFDASKNGGRLIGIVKGLDVYSLDQFALKNNRPDLLLKSMGLGTPELIGHYYDRYQKRIKKAGYTEQTLASDIHVPVVAITGYQQNDKVVEVGFELEDKLSLLKKYNVYVNDVPLFDAGGKVVTGNKASKKEIIELTNGFNKIEISCVNEKGVESLRQLIRINYEKPAKGDLYFLGFGVSKYANPKLNLQYADKDAKDLAALFSKMKGTEFDNVYTKLYLNEQVTSANIKAAKAFFVKAKPDDTFILFIAGHGVHDTDKAGTYYYLTHNANTGALSTTAANFELIEDLLQGIKPRKKLFFMDTCESGEIEEEDESQIYTSADARSIKARTARGMKLVKSATGKRGYLYQKDRYIYNDINRRSGAIVFSSSKGGEFSFESETIENGFFTEEIMNALSTGSKADQDGNGIINTDELRAFVEKQVAMKTGDLQHPTVDRDNLILQFNFPLVQN